MSTGNELESEEYLKAGGDRYVFFWKNPFSQQYVSEFTCISVVDEDLDIKTYNCVEQFLMSEKALLFEDKESFDKIMESKSPKVQKELGRNIRGFKNKKWNHMKVKISLAGNMAKFTQNPNLRQHLLNTGTKTIVEASPSDDIWGIGIGIQDPKIGQPKRWKGQNLLGKVLMETRKRILADIKEDMVDESINDSCSEQELDIISIDYSEMTEIQLLDEQDRIKAEIERLKSALVDINFELAHR